MEIFNEILKFNNNKIVILYDNLNNIWFGLRDIIKALDYKNIENAISAIKINREYKITYNKITFFEPPSAQGGSKIKPHKIFINEAGLYELLSISTKPLARIFMDKYFTEIMPEIRKNGKYIMDNKNKKVLDKLNIKIKKITDTNKNLIINQKNINYPKGKAIYIITKIIDKKKYFKIGYTTNLNRRLKVYNTSFPNKILFNYFLIVNSKKVDGCIKNLLKNEEFIKNKEYYLTSLTKIILFIKKCDNKLNKINCGYCLKSYSFNKIKMHKCKFL